ILAAVGTGTTLAGLIEASDSHQKIIGIPVLKNAFSLQKEIETLIAKENRERFTLLHDYHFGGYANYSKALISFMNEWFESTAIPSDFVYPGKLFFAVNELVQKNYFPDNSKILVVHSGGLQGNRSLPKGTLIFYSGSYLCPVFLITCPAFMKYSCLFILVFLLLSAVSFGQDTLPKFSVTNAGNNRVIIGWVNTYGLVKQISIQRSFDSL